MADYLLPTEILSEIFSHLPPQSLLQFRSTSKSLKSIIDSHNFTNLHLKNSLNFSLILRHNNTDLHHLHFPNLTTAIPLNHPLFYTNRIEFFGSCNGLLCISSNTETAFWNPNIRKHRIIPYLPIAFPRSDTNIHFASISIHGFGFDPFSSGYKLLRISWFVDIHNHTFDSYVSLFTSKTNSWKVLPDAEYALCYENTMGVFVENSNSSYLHWMMTRKFDDFQPLLIVAFNLTLEIFNEVPFPGEIGVASKGRFEINVANLGGCLCLIANHHTKIDVWVMKEYGCRDSWCKLFTLMKLCFVLPLKSLSPLGYSSDGKKVLLEVNHKKLVWYDLKSHQVSYVEGIPNFNEAIICVGSLVPPSFPVDNSRKKENHSSKSKRRDDFLSKGFKLTL